jgi:hypothetical protein
MNTLIINRYDNEFIGLLNEIGNRLFYFNREDAMKIKSWIQLLSKPYETKEEKQNRNLYAIKLLNQMINGKLKNPFFNYCKTNKLKQLLPIDIKSELTEKFFKEINFNDIVNFGYQKQNQFLQTHPEYCTNNMINNNNISKFEEDSFSFTNFSNADKNRLTQRIENENNIDMDQYNNVENLDDYDDDIIDNDKLYEIIEQLENYINETDLIIENQNNEIQKLVNILYNLINKTDINEENK